MKYDRMLPGIFKSRPNRFIANIEVNGKIEVCHVKNTGRCKELLTLDANVFVQESNNPNRKTKFSLISVKKDKKLINMDSQVPNKVVHEWILKGGLFKNITLIKPESKYNNSRFDFYVEADNKKIFIEVKGVTLEDKGVVRFPDAPTERGVKHIKELCDAISEGYEAYVIFVIQMKDVLYFEPNSETHKAFAEALKYAKKSGVNILAVDCDVTKDTIEIRDFVDIRL